MNIRDDLGELGWSEHFADQILDTDIDLTPMRVTEVHRTRLRAFAEPNPDRSALRLVLPSAITSADVAVGDWVMVENDTLRVSRGLERTSILSRRAAGAEHRAQLVAANVDTLLVVTSCNDDFNEARLERFIAMAIDAGAEPVVVLTKADRVDDPAPYLERARALSPDQVALTLNSKDPADLVKLHPWCGTGQTVALLGSSGVGKTTITNGLAGTSEAVGDIRETDAKGRHTTTARALHRIAGGGWLLDTPGVRELGLIDAAGGIEGVFSDIVEIANTCKFRDCAHVGEPGCAVQIAVNDGAIDAERLERWRKLSGENDKQLETKRMSRKRDKNVTKYQKSVQRSRSRAKGRDGEDH
jgi:ribosome biogenesis GTPase